MEDVKNKSIFPAMLWTITIFLAILKIAGVIDISWLLVILPVLIPVIILSIIVGVVFIIAIVLSVIAIIEKLVR